MAIYKFNEVVVGPLQYTVTVPDGAAYRVLTVTIRIGAGPTTSENMTITLDNRAGAQYDTRLYTVDPSVLPSTNIVWYPDGFELWLVGGDALYIEYANSDHNTIAAQVTLAG